MSAFLGPIHTWMFRKIKFQNELTDTIITKVCDKEQAKELFSQMERQFGNLEPGELGDIIDENNIHGWLQSRITLVENRLAYAVTVLVKDNTDLINEILEVIYNFGVEHGAKTGITVSEAFEHMENLLLNGMPCDHVNHILSESDDCIVWEQTTDIHRKYWDQAEGRIDYYYAIRESLTRGILAATSIHCRQIGDQKFELKKA